MRNDNERRWRPRLLLGAATALVLGALVLAGCGGSSGGSSESSSTTNSGSEGSQPEGKAAGPGGFNISDEQRACLEEKGVELPEINSEGGGPPEGFEPPEGGEPPQGGVPGNSKAFEECGIETPESKGGPGGEGAPNVNSAAFEKQVKEYVACVRENGYELAEPDFSGEGPIFDRSESESAAFKKASAKCQNLIGGPTPGAGASRAGGEEG